MAIIRSARASDHAAFSTLFPELRVDDPTPSLERWTTEMVPTTFVAEESGTVVGYTYFQVFAGEGIIRHLVVAPSHHGRRIGQQLMTSAAEVMRRAGATRWSLNVKPDNVPALRLYRRMGMKEQHHSQSLRFAWTLPARLPSPGASVTPFEISPAQDAEVEAIGFPRGMLANARALPHRVLMAVRESTKVVGAAVFNPTFPGAYPFRADSPAAARALLEALQPCALAEPPYMQVVIEGQPSLAQALVEAGAVVRLDIVHLEGPLP